MRQRKSYEKDAFTTVIESLSTTSSDTESPAKDEVEAPFPREETRVTIISEIEKRLTHFPHKLLHPSSSTPDTALVLYRSPESMGLPKLERQKQVDLKVAFRKRIQDKRRGERKIIKDEDGYEADAEDWEESPRKQHQQQNLLLANGFQPNSGWGFSRSDQLGVVNGFHDMDNDGDMMDLD
jgi:hypothetical protein